MRDNIDRCAVQSKLNAQVLSKLLKCLAAAERRPPNFPLRVVKVTMRVYLVRFVQFRLVRKLN